MNHTAQHSTAQHSTAQHNFKRVAFPANVKRAFSLVCGTLLISSVAHATPELITGTTFKLDMAPAAAQANGRKVSLSGMQLTDATGATAYYDVTFEFGVLADGNVGMRLTSASPSTFIQGSTFVAGNYSDPAGNIYRVTGPTPTATNRLEYNISLTTTTSSTGSKQGFEAQWQTGIVDGNPLLVDQYTKPNVGTSAGFGLSQSDAGYFSPSGDSTWYPGYVIGATQTSPTTLKLNYYFGNKTPYRSVTLTKI